MGSIVKDIYDDVVEDLQGETDDAIKKIAETYYGIRSKDFSRETLIDKIASVEVEAYLK